MDNSKTFLKITVMINMVELLLLCDCLLSIIHRLKLKFIGTAFKSFHHPCFTYSCDMVSYRLSLSVPNALLTFLSHF